METLSEGLIADSSADTVKSKVCVAVRVRPFIERELADNEEKWIVNDNGLTQNDELKTGAGIYTYDHVFGKSTQTKEIYDEVVAPVVNKAFKGFSGTVLCYGQTSSGKTHTLYGSASDKGIISLFAEHLFQQVKKDEGHKEYIVSVGVIEIYNEKLTDLLNSDNTIDIQLTKDGAIVPTGLEQLTVNCSQELIEISERAQQQRKTGETAMNKSSSRSHTALRVKIEMADFNSNGADKIFTGSGNPALTTSILHFVDLAGSEKQSQTGAVGERLNEAININKSLSSLSKVINSLSVNAEQNEKSMQRNAVTDPRREPKSRFFVNYRDSKLTRLLQSTLNGEAHITMICNVTVANVAETKSTLEFANRAKNIKVQPKQNFSTSNEFEKKVLELQQSLQMRDQENDRLMRKIEHLQKIMPQTKQSSFQPLLRTPENIEMRRYSLCLPPRRSDRDKVSVFAVPNPISRLSDDGFMSSTDTTMHFHQLTKDRESQCFDKGCDKETQTEYLLCIGSGRIRQRTDPNDTPVTTLRMCNSLLREANQCDHLEFNERLAFLEAENKVLSVFEAENITLRHEQTELAEKIRTLTSEKLELENDVLRQMESSKKGWARQIAEYDEKRSKEFTEMEQTLQKSQIELEEAKILLQNLQLKLQESEGILGEKEMLLQNQNDFKKAQDELVETKSLLEDLQSKFNESKQILDEKETKLEQVHNDFKKAQDESDESQRLLQSFKLKLDESEWILQKKDSMLSQNQDDLQKTQDELLEMKGLFADLQSKHNASEHILEEKDTRLVQAQNDFKKAQDELEETRRSLQSLKLKLDESEHLLKTKDEAMIQNQDKLQKTQDDLVETHKIIRTLESKYNGLKEVLEQRDPMIEEVKADLKRAEEEHELEKQILTLKLEASERAIKTKDAALMDNINTFEITKRETLELIDSINLLQSRFDQQEYIIEEKETELQQVLNDFQKAQDELEETQGSLKSLKLKLSESEQRLETKDVMLIQNQNDFQKAQIELVETKSLVEHLQSKLNESERMFEEKEKKLAQVEINYEKTEKELLAAIDALTALDVKLSQLEGVEKRLQAMKDSEGAVRVSRGAQCEIIQESDFEELKAKAKQYKDCARFYKVELDKHKEDIAFLEEKNERIVMLESMLDSKDLDIKSLQEKILDVSEDPKLMLEEGTQCSLLFEQLTRAGQGEQGLLPDFVPDIYKLRNELRLAKEKAQRLQMLVSKCQCESSGKVFKGSAVKSAFSGLVSFESKTKSNVSSATKSLGFKNPLHQYVVAKILAPNLMKNSTSAESTGASPEDSRENTPPSPQIAELKDPEPAQIICEPKQSPEVEVVSDTEMLEEPDVDELMKEMQAIRALCPSNRKK